MAAEYDQRSDDEFLRWLWGQLYQVEPAPAEAVAAGGSTERVRAGCSGEYWLKWLLNGDREGLPSDAISLAADGDNWGTDDEFLMWLRAELYPGEQ